MTLSQPHYFLFCNTQANPSQDTAPRRSCHGRWHFVLEQLDGAERLEAADSEYAVNDERLALLSVVRGLEALEQPSKVTLVTTSRYVSRGLRYGLETWREAGYQWERFGERKPIRNADLWQRVDGALQFHGVTCRLLDSGRTNSPQLRDASETTPQAPPVIEDNESPAAEASAILPEAVKADRQDWIHNAESRLLQLESKLAYWQAQVRRERNPADLVQPVAPRDFWWRLAAFWLKWWRGRFQPNHALMGT